MPTKKSIKSLEDHKKQKSWESENKRESNKRVVIKRRKTELKPTRASAIAIAAQANRAKKQALIEKVAASDDVLPIKQETTNETDWMRECYGRW